MCQLTFNNKNKKTSNKRTSNKKCSNKKTYKMTCNAKTYLKQRVCKLEDAAVFYWKKPQKELTKNCIETQPILFVPPLLLFLTHWEWKCEKRKLFYCFLLEVKCPYTFSEAFLSWLFERNCLNSFHSLYNDAATVDWKKLTEKKSKNIWDLIEL